MKTALLRDGRFAGHDDPAHPERAARLAALDPQLDALDPALFAALPFGAADETALLAVHERRMLEYTQMLAHEGGGTIDPDTYVTHDSWAAARLAAGAVVAATAAVVAGEARNAFAVVRPPGHHATPGQAMGFCLVNNVAVAARYATTVLGLERVAIIDWDVHHGNGTQDIFYADGRVLFCSTHAYPFYPGTGHWHELGAGAGVGATLNVPLPLDSGDATFLQAYDEAILPAVARFAPELILVSAGYDAHWADPLGRLNVSTAAYTQLAARVYTLAAQCCAGRLVCALEGGYDPAALAECVLGTLGVLAGRPELAAALPAPPAAATPSIARVLAGLREHHPLLR